MKDKEKKKWVPLILNDDWANVSNVAEEIEKMNIKTEIIGNFSLIFQAKSSSDVQKKMKGLYGGDHHFGFFFPVEKKTARSICFREEIKKCKRDLLYSLYDAIQTLIDKV